MRYVKRVDRVGPAIDYSTPAKTIRDLRRAAGQCEQCGEDLVACKCGKRVDRRDA